MTNHRLSTSARRLAYTAVGAAMCAALLVPSSSGAVTARRGVWTGSAISKDGNWTSLSFSVSATRVNRFVTGRKTEVPCFSFVSPGLTYPPMFFSAHIPWSHKSRSAFWGKHTERFSDGGTFYQMSLNGKWRTATKATGKFTIDADLCYATYTFNAHWRSR
jgi:hypothetical protein